MPEEIVPKEQMEVFNQGRTERRPSLPPRRMAEAPMEEAISEVPMEEEVMDTGLSRSDPKTLLADFGNFLIGLPNEKTTFMKSFVLIFLISIFSFLNYYYYFLFYLNNCS